MTEFMKTHYFKNCKMVLGRLQCPVALPLQHLFYTSAACGELKCPCKDLYVKLLFRARALCYHSVFPVLLITLVS